MKTFFITFIGLILITTVGTAQRTFDYKIDQKQYKVDEKTLNDLFGKAFNALIENHWTDNNHFSLWVASYSDWKDKTVEGTFIFELFGNRIAKSSFEGTIPQEYLGWKAEGKNASGNPNKESNISKRMGLINHFLSRQLIYYFTGKTVVN